MHSVRRVGMALDRLRWQQCFALHYWNAGWIWGCPRAVVTAPAQRLLCSMNWLALFFSPFLPFQAVMSGPEEMWFLLFFSAQKALVLLVCFFFSIFETVFWCLQVEMQQEGKKNPKGRELKFDLQIYLVDVVEITELFYGGNKVQYVVCFRGQVCQM